jgi:hypothetical protein
MSATAIPLIATRLKEKVNPVSTKTIDINNQGEFIGIRYFLTANGNGRAKGMDISVLDDNGNLNDSVFSILGGGISISINIFRIGSDIKLEVTNNETFDVDIEVLKFLTGIN